MSKRRTDIPRDIERVLIENGLEYVLEWSTGTDVPSLPELDVCSACHDHTAWELDEENTWVSVCCGAGPIDVDQEPLLDDGVWDDAPLTEETK